MTQHLSPRRSHALFTLCALLAAAFVLLAAPLPAQSLSRFPDIPRIDVHTHITSDTVTITNYLVMRRLLKERYGEEMAMWINLESRTDNHPDPAAVAKASQGRILCSIANFTPQRGVAYPPESLADWMKKGYIGYKIWAGPPARVLQPGEKGYPYIDDPVHEPTFAAVEKLGILLTSIHIADPNGPYGDRTKWLADPVEFWRQQAAFRHVMERHPNMKVVAAHGLWLVCQDAQIDCLRNMLDTFPNLNVDLSATFQYYNLVQRNNLRDFMIHYADRILFGSDFGIMKRESSYISDSYHRFFQILENDGKIEGNFYGNRPVEGLALPREVLEKIYYRNAVRLYPGVRAAMLKLGYPVE